MPCQILNPFSNGQMHKVSESLSTIDYLQSFKTECTAAKAKSEHYDLLNLSDMESLYAVPLK